MINWHRRPRARELEAEVARLRTDVADRDRAIEAKNLELARLQYHLEQAMPPDVEDSPAWSATTPTVIGDRATSLSSDVEEALAKVLAFGGAMRRCAECNAPATTSWATEYEWRGDDVMVIFNEDCTECGASYAGRFTPQTWACMEAMRAWEACRTARAVLRSEQQNARDLEDLDQDAPIPVALQRCRKCDRWLESRDGKAPCVCAEPDVYQG